MNFRLKISHTVYEVTKYLLFLYLFTLTTSFNLFDLGGRNTLYLATSCVGVLLLIVIWFRRFPNFTNNHVLFLMAYMMISYFIVIDNARTTSFLYSIFFLLSFLIFSSFCIKFFDARDLTRVVKIILFAYFLVTVVGQVYIWLGYFNPVLDPGVGVVHGSFGTAFSRDSNSIRYYSLSTEPSYAAIIVIFLYYIYLELVKRINEGSNTLLISVIVFYMVFIFNSGYGFLLFGILLWIRLKEQRPLWAAVGLVVLTALFASLLMIDFDIYSITRIKNILSNFDITDITSIREIDYSASFRILPFYYYFKTIDLSSYQFYLGYGAGTSDVLLNKYLFPHAVEEVTFLGGFLPGFLIDYGLVGFLVFVFAYIRETKSLFSFGVILMLFTMTNANFNTQLFWIVFTFQYLNRRVVNSLDS